MAWKIGPALHVLDNLRVDEDAGCRISLYDPGPDTGDCLRTPEKICCKRCRVEEITAHLV
jgi:hypothetical protein